MVMPLLSNVFKASCEDRSLEGRLGVLIGSFQPIRLKNPILVRERYAADGEVVLMLRFGTGFFLINVG